MRKAVGIFIMMVTGLLLYTMPVNLNLGLRQGMAQGMESFVKKIQAFADPTPPTPPQSLSEGLAPIIQGVASYRSTTHLTNHTMAPFDSTGGDLLVVCAGTHEDALLTPSDNYNNTWISLAGPTNFGPTSSSDGINIRAQIWYAKNPKVGPNHIFTMTLPTREALVLSMFIVKGSHLSNPIDAVSTIGNDADTLALAPTSPSITTTHSIDLLIGYGKSRYSQVWRAGARFTLQPAASSDYLAAESGLAPTPGSYNATFAINRPTNWQAAVVAVRPVESLPKTAQITLAWQQAIDNVAVTGYEVERCRGVDCENFAQIGTSKNTSFVNSTPPAPTVYRYRVRAIDAAGAVSKYSNTIIVKVNPAAN